jgi:hypothetical protein
MRTCPSACDLKVQSSDISNMCQFYKIKARFGSVIELFDPYQDRLSDSLALPPSSELSSSRQARVLALNDAADGAVHK